jgi:DNA polymerase-3 subunit epsilon/CBS domain-containing protein
MTATLPAATSLRSLTAVVIDTETTSLDTRKGRIIELGAVLIAEGRLVRQSTFSALVNPGENVPKAAAQIHGITSEMLTQAESFAAVAKRFRAFAAHHLLLGYSIDFDLAMLKREHELAGLAWVPPRVIDVQDLVRLLKPTLPDLALETVAGWLGITVGERHRALPDATLTADVFLALLPRLRERGVRTLGEAVKACRKSDDLPAPAEALMHVDSYPYRHRIGAVMSKPPRLIAASATLKQALDLMMEARVSSLFVEPERQSYGIVTERDILRAIAKDGARAFDRRLAQVANFPLECVAESDFIYVALGLMRRRGFRHLGVIDDTGDLTGALTQRDLLRLRADHALALTGALDEVADVPALAQVWRRLADAARALLVEGVAARDIAAIVSQEVCALTARAALMAEREIGSPESRRLKFAVMVLGSGGRGESLLALDQDNAIVFEAADIDAAQGWLKPFATRMNAILDEIGVPFCKGGVMAKNDAWRLSAQDWRRKVAGWLAQSTPQNIMNADIFFDALPVYGEAELADDLRRDAIEAASRTAPFLKLMSLNAVSAEAPRGWFGRFAVAEDGRLDLKMHGIMPIFTAARIAALRHTIAERSTRARLEALRGKPEMPERAIDALIEAHGVLMGAILRQQLADIASGIPPSNRVDPKLLSAVEKERLKWALTQIAAVRDILGDPVG